MWRIDGAYVLQEGGIVAEKARLNLIVVLGTFVFSHLMLSLI
jgi:hypothetical protein